MLAGGQFYPYSCDPKDVWLAMNKDRENLMFIDVQARGYYPSYAKKVFKEKDINIEIQTDDLEILKNILWILFHLVIISHAALVLILVVV